MEYHLISLNGNDTKITIDDPAIWDRFWKTWLVNTGSRQSYIETDSTNTPWRWEDYPKYITYNTLWQDWAGKWFTLTGYFLQPGLFEVKTYQEIQPPLGTPSSTTLNPTTTFPLHRARQVTLKGVVEITGRNPLLLDDPNYGFIYTLTDINGNKVQVVVYAAPPCQTEVVDLDGKSTGFLRLSGKLVKFVGWIFDFPPSKGSPYDVVDLQRVEVISPSINSATPEVH